MCGINGFTFKDENLIQKMNQKTSHRGPDETDFFVGDNISLGHNRLSIIDLSDKAHQPMWDHKKELVIIFNGEIYNFKELRKDLESKYNFQSQSDTEVILNCYREYGEECVKKFNGIFAFAIWDTRNNELFIARDHIGVKPLYYYQKDGKFIFSSEIKAILEHPIKREVDNRAFNLYFQLLYTPEPYTMFKDIKKLPIASWMKVKQGEVKIERYWDPQVSINTESYEDIKESIRNTFDDSIKKQLISDRPLGVFLSGGMDSTAVLGSVRENRKDKIKTFSVGFKDSTDEEKFNSDFNLARETSKHYNTDHIELMISANDIKDNLSSIVHHLDEPNSNPTAGAIFLLSQLTKKEVAVVLGGDGGDELFGGYPRYYYSALISFYQNQPNVIQKLGSTFLSIAGNKSALDKLSLPANEKRVLSFLAQKQNLLSRAIQTDKLSPQASQLFMEDRFFSQDAGDADFENKFMDTDRQSWLVDESLMRTDKMTMAFGLEARVPILDKRLVELAKSIPSKHKLNIFKSTPNSFQGKTIWRDAIDSYLPNHVKNQKKRGWFTPMAKWIRTDLKDLVSDTLSENNLNSEYFNTKEVQKILDDHITKKQYNLSIIWAIFMWQLWYDQYIKNSK